ncbi:hypothetical protein N7467_012249 [Penicillium canescens]|nr:hypothetical protein N7467_012249 [Penicillium canescens]
MHRSAETSYFFLASVDSFSRIYLMPKLDSVLSTNLFDREMRGSEDEMATPGPVMDALTELAV